MRFSCLGVLREVARLYAQQGAIDQAVRSCRQILRVEPWREAVYRWLMGYLAAGRRCGLLRVFSDKYPPARRC